MYRRAASLWVPVLVGFGYLAWAYGSINLRSGCAGGAGFVDDSDLFDGACGGGGLIGLFWIGVFASSACCFVAIGGCRGQTLFGTRREPIHGELIGDIHVANCPRNRISLPDHPIDQPGFARREKAPSSDPVGHLLPLREKDSSGCRRLIAVAKRMPSLLPLVGERAATAADEGDSPHTNANFYRAFGAGPLPGALGDRTSPKRAPHGCRSWRPPGARARPRTQHG